MIKTLLRSFNAAGFPLFLDHRINHFAVLDGQYPLVPFIQRDSYMSAIPPCV